MDSLANVLGVRVYELSGRILFPFLCSFYLLLFWLVDSSISTTVKHPLIKYSHHSEKKKNEKDVLAASSVKFSGHPLLCWLTEKINKGEKIGI